MFIHVAFATAALALPAGVAAVGAPPVGLHREAVPASAVATVSRAEGDLCHYLPICGA